MKKIIIGLDVDGVIRDFHTGYNQAFIQHFPEHSNKTIPKPDSWNCFFRYGWNEILAKKWNKEVHNINLIDIEKESIYWMMNDAAKLIFEKSPIYPGTKNSVNLLKKFCEDNNFELTILSHQVGKGLGYTVNWLSKHGIYLNSYKFVKTAEDKWNHCDIMIDDAPKVLLSKPSDKVSIKIEHLYNQDCDSTFSIEDLNDIGKLFNFLLQIKKEKTNVNI